MFSLPEYCCNTEFESSEEEDLVEVNSEIFEEYELPSDDAKDEKDQFSDSDSSIDVSIHNNIGSILVLHSRHIVKRIINR